MLIVWERYMTRSFVPLALVEKMPGVVQHDKKHRAPEGFSQTEYLYHLVRALFKCDDLLLVWTGTAIKSSSRLTVCNFVN